MEVYIKMNEKSINLLQKAYFNKKVENCKFKKL